MNDAYYTETGERPALAALEVNAPEGYIGSQILPTVPVTEKSGTVFYATVTADGAAETDRAVGVGPDSAQIADSNAAMSCGEASRRGKISPDEVKTMGGIEKADVVGAKYAKRSVMNAMEAAIAAEILGTADDTFDPAKLMQDAQTALDAIRLYEGRTALIASTMVVRKMVQGLLTDSLMGNVFARTISGSSPAVAAQGMSLKAWADGLAMFLGVDQVLLGDSTIWNAGDCAGKFAIAKLDDGSDPLSHKWRPVLGKVFQFLPDGQNPWVIQTVADRVNVNNLYDAYLWYDVMILNAPAVYVFDGVQ